MSRGKPRERGQTVIEFALLAPVIFVLLFMIVDFGLALDRRITLQHAVREGARYAAVAGSNDCGKILEKTLAQAQGIDATVTVSYDADPGDPARLGDTVTVSAQFTYEPKITNSIAGLLGVTAPSMVMTPSASSRLEREVSPAAGCPP